MLVLTFNWVLVTYLCMTMTDRKINPFPHDPKSLLKKEDLKVYFDISLPSIVMLCAEWWAYEFMTIMAT